MAVRIPGGHFPDDHGGGASLRRLPLEALALMCGRYAITLPPEAYRRAFNYAEHPNFPPRFNIAPTQPVPIIFSDKGVRHFMLVRWGFVPGWAKSAADFPLLINARGETLLEKAAFKNALKRRRCIFLADGFYEWGRNGREKQPFLIRPVSRGVMPLAGLWETYSDATGSEIDTAAIVTTDANGLLSAIHTRMPVILDDAGVDAWLNVEEVSDKEAMALVRPCADDGLDLVPVSSRVNKVDNDDPSIQETLVVAKSMPAPEASARAKRARAAEEQGELF
jgi:putative SOS response-associated peptidase YedK